MIECIFLEIVEIIDRSGRDLEDINNTCLSYDSRTETAIGHIDIHSEFSCFSVHSYGTQFHIQLFIQSGFLG